MNEGVKRNGIAVYCASSQQVDEVYMDSAREMGRLIADNGFTLVNGGGVRGLMAATIEGVLAHGGEAVGVLPRFMVEKGWAHPGLTRKHVTETMHERKALMADMSCGAVALAGGIGTLDELCEMMTWRQLGLFKGPVVIVNTEGFYDPFIEMLERMRAQHFMRDEKMPVSVVSTPAEAMDIINESKR